MSVMLQPIKAALKDTEQLGNQSRSGSSQEEEREGRARCGVSVAR